MKPLFREILLRTLGIACLVLFLLAMLTLGRAHGAPLSSAPDMHAAEYEYAHAEAHRTHRPLLVLVGASWCEACHAVERTCLGALRAIGHVVVLDYDRDPKLIVAFQHGQRPLPTLYVFEQDHLGIWKRETYIGLPAIGGYVRTAPVKPLLGAQR